MRSPLSFPSRAAPCPTCCHARRKLLSSALRDGARRARIVGHSDRNFRYLSGVPRADVTEVQVVSSVIWFLVFVLGALTLAYHRASLLTATLVYGGGLLVYALFG